MGGAGHFQGGAPNSSQLFEGGPLIFSQLFEGGPSILSLIFDANDNFSAGLRPVSYIIILHILHKNRL